MTRKTTVKIVFINTSNSLRSNSVTKGSNEQLADNQIRTQGSSCRYKPLKLRHHRTHPSKICFVILVCTTLSPNWSLPTEVRTSGPAKCLHRLYTQQTSGLSHVGNTGRRLCCVGTRITCRMVSHSHNCYTLNLAGGQTGNQQHNADVPEVKGYTL